MMRRIVYTSHAGMLMICEPNQETMSAMSTGGLWRDYPKGFVDIQIDRQIADGVAPDVAARYARSVAFGGCSTSEALEIIRDRDCAPNGYNIDLMDVSEIPADKWFRDAWMRSHNGGPIGVSMKKAKDIQFSRVRQRLKRKSEANVGQWWSKIRRANTPEEIRSIFPV